MKIINLKMHNLRRKFNNKVHDVLDGSSRLAKISLMETAFVSMVMAMMAVFGGFLYMHDVFSADLDSKDIQVNSLIQEVGDLKDENVALYQEVLSGQNDVDGLSASVEVLGNEIALLGNGEVDIDLLLSDMQSLQTQIEQQKDVVASVVTESTEFARQSYVSADETFDVLILGTHGTLTDTLMVASVNPELETVTLISIPRDLSVNGRKINEHYNLYGADQMKQAVYELIGILPEKYVVVDMQAFTEIVDAIGGIDLYVDKELYDNQYPDGYGGYSAFYMATGDQHMDGSTALKYARSRKSTSDFDRADRQQDVVLAVREKVASMNLVSDPSTAVTMFRAILDNMDTDIGLFEGIGYYSDFSDYTVETGNVLSTGNYLYSTYNVYGQYILMPNSGDSSMIKEWVAGLVGS